MPSDNRSVHPTVTSQDCVSPAGEARGQSRRPHGFVAQMRGLWAAQPLKALTREEWADVRQKLAPCRPPQPARRFGPHPLVSPY